jgi:hypothetical protein
MDRRRFATTPQTPEQSESAKRLSLARLKRRATSISLCPAPIAGADVDQRVVMIPVLALEAACPETNLPFVYL